MPYSDELAKSVMRNLQAQLRLNRSYDVTVSVQNKEFPCHRLILCACSKYFSDLIQNYESTDPVILININAETFKQVLECLYGAEDILTEENASDLWRAAHQLEIDFLCDACEQFKLVRLSAKSCVEINNLAKELGSQTVKTAAWDELVREFRTVYARGDFVTLDYDDILALVRHEDLAAPCEDAVVMAAVKWMDHSPQADESESGNHGYRNDAESSDRSSRKVFAFQLLSSCRLHLASGSCLQTLVNTNWVIQKKKVYYLVCDALSYHLLPERRGFYCPLQAVHRSSSPLENCIVAVYKNNNGSHIFSCRDPEGTYYQLGGGLSEVYMAAYGAELYFVSSQPPQKGEGLTVRKFNTVNGDWQDVPSLTSTSSTICGLICLDHYIYALEANTGTFHRLDILEEGAGIWEKVGRLNASVGNVALTLNESAIVVLGKENGAHEVTVQIFDTLTTSCRVSPFKLESNASGMVTFQTVKHTYVLLSTGQVWELDACDRQPEYKGMLFDGELPRLLSAVTFKDELILSLGVVDASTSRQWNTICVTGVSRVRIADRPGGCCLLNAVIPVSLMVHEDSQQTRLMVREDSQQTSLMVRGDSQ